VIFRFFNARDAILEADKILTGGENKCELWSGFSERGLVSSIFSPVTVGPVDICSYRDLTPPLLVRPRGGVASALTTSTCPRASATTSSDDRCPTSKACVVDFGIQALVNVCSTDISYSYTASSPIQIHYKRSTRGINQAMSRRWFMLRLGSSIVH
jgi:hypothetical protein